MPRYRVWDSNAMPKHTRNEWFLCCRSRGQDVNLSICQTHACNTDSSENSSLIVAQILQPTHRAGCAGIFRRQTHHILDEAHKHRNIYLKHMCCECVRVYVCTCRKDQEMGVGHNSHITLKSFPTRTARSRSCRCWISPAKCLADIFLFLPHYIEEAHTHTWVRIVLPATTTPQTRTLWWHPIATQHTQKRPKTDGKLCVNIVCAGLFGTSQHT